MVLQNYWAWRAQTQNNAATSTLTGITGITDMTGTAVTTLYSSSSGAGIWNNRVLSSSRSDITYLRLVFGSGDTTPTVLDYDLAADESANLTLVGMNSINYASDRMEIVFPYTATNNTASDIELKEVGIVKKVTTTNGVYADVLIAREVLSSPITIAAGETKTINYTWTMQ